MRRSDVGRLLRFTALLLSSLLFQTPGLAQTQIDPTFAGIRGAIERYEADFPGTTLTIPQILERLPREFRSSFALMRESGSIQGATEANPRVIMFGDNARTIMAFNGEASQLGYARLEFASIAPTSGRLEFRKIEFPVGDSGQGQATFSEPNPRACMGCHGPAPHYIWGQYAIWPGAYGSRDDALGMVAGETEALASFRAEATAHPRYRHLNFEFQNLSAVAPYRPLLSGGNPDERGDYNLAFEFRPNARFGMFLLRHQSQERIEAAAAKVGFEAAKYGFAFFLAGCETRVDSGLVRRVVAATGARNYRDYAIRFGLNPNEAWHLERGASETRASDYYAGLSTFRSAMLGELWRHHLNGDESFRPYFKPVPLIDYVTASNYHYFVTERGLSFWNALEREGSILSGFPGGGEADLLAADEGFSPLSAPEVSAACRVFAERQLQ